METSLKPAIAEQKIHAMNKHCVYTVQEKKGYKCSILYIIRDKQHFYLPQVCLLRFLEVNLALLLSFKAVYKKYGNDREFESHHSPALSFLRRQDFFSDVYYKDLPPA